MASREAVVAPPLQLAMAEVVIGMLARLGFIVVMQLVAAGALLTSQLVTTSHSDVQQVGPILDYAPSRETDVDADKDDGDRTDLYGNEITPAVAKYKLDAAGSLYELHSPRTEIPRLGSP